MSSSAKELEHYRHVRQTFESVSEAPKKKPRLPPTRLPAPITNVAPLSTQLKQKSRSKPKGKQEGKGKGKALHLDRYDDDDSVDEEDEDEDEAYLTSQDFGDSPVKRVMRNGMKGDEFGDVGNEDDEEIYGV